MGTVGVGGAFTCGFDALDTTSIRKMIQNNVIYRHELSNNSISS